MALTAAEKQKRYREKIKNDPVKYEIQKKKDLERLKRNTKTKNIAEMTEEEKLNQRKIWREKKKKQKLNREKNIDKEERKESYSNKIVTRYHLVVRKYKTALARINKLTKCLDAARNKHNRLKTKYFEKQAETEDVISKMKAREELLEATLCSVYKKCQNKNEKDVLKKLTTESLVKKNRKVGYVTKMLGLRANIKRKKQKLPTPPEVPNEIKAFYLRDDISRSTSGKKECRTFKKEKQQKRYLVDNLINLYKMYKEEGGKYSFSTFYKHKPFYVLSPSVLNRETCLCVKHNNIEMLFDALKRNKILQSFENLTQLLNSLVCDTKTRECMYEECEKCKNKAAEYNLQNETSGAKLQWRKWERIDHQYQKQENGQQKTFTTKKTVKVTKEGSIEDLIKEFENSLKSHKIHCYNVYHQQNKYQEIVKNLDTNEALILCDFSQNYEAKLGEEVQATHFGASKNQITLHTGMIYWANEAQSFCTISDCNAHDPPAIWAHLIPIIKMIKTKTPEVNTIHFYSDGPSSQYRQKKIFYLLTLFGQKFNLVFTTWSFFESGHGKGAADAIGGTVKRALDRNVSYGHDVVNGQDAYEILNKCMKSVKCIYVSEEDVKNIGKLVPVLRPVPGTLKIHQIIFKNMTTSSENGVHYRNFSCFCTKRELCDCYGPKKHLFPTIPQQTTTGQFNSRIQSELLLESEIPESHNSAEITNENIDADQSPKASQPIKKRHVNVMVPITRQDMKKNSLSNKPMEKKRVKVLIPKSYDILKETKKAKSPTKERQVLVMTPQKKQNKDDIIEEFQFPVKQQELTPLKKQVMLKETVEDNHVTNKIQVKAMVHWSDKVTKNNIETEQPTQKQQMLTLQKKQDADENTITVRPSKGFQKITPEKILHSLGGTVEAEKPKKERQMTLMTPQKRQDMEDVIEADPPTKKLQMLTPRKEKDKEDNIKTDRPAKLHILTPHDDIEENMKAKRLTKKLQIIIPQKKRDTEENIKADRSTKKIQKLTPQKIHYNLGETIEAENHNNKRQIIAKTPRKRQDMEDIIKTDQPTKKLQMLTLRKKQGTEENIKTSESLEEIKEAENPRKEGQIIVITPRKRQYVEDNIETDKPKKKVQMLTPRKKEDTEGDIRVKNLGATIEAENTKKKKNMLMTPRKRHGMENDIKDNQLSMNHNIWTPQLKQDVVMKKPTSPKKFQNVDIEYIFEEYPTLTLLDPNPNDSNIYSTGSNLTEGSHGPNFLDEVSLEQSESFQILNPNEIENNSENTAPTRSQRVIIEKIEVIQPSNLNVSPNRRIKPEIKFKGCSKKFGKNDNIIIKKKSLQTIVSRLVQCHDCKIEMHISTATNKCILCAYKYCLVCSGGEIIDNFICLTCLE